CRLQDGEALCRKGFQARKPRAGGGLHLERFHLVSLLVRFHDFRHCCLGQKQNACHGYGVLQRNPDNLVGSTIPLAVRSTYSFRAASKPVFPSPSSMRATTTPPSAEEFSAICLAGLVREF